MILSEKELNTLADAVSLTVQKLCRWCIENKLKVSIEKIDFVLFHPPIIPLVENFREIETKAINIKPVVTYLVVTIDELIWNAHVENVSNSPIKFYGLFKQLRHKMINNTVYYRSLTVSCIIYSEIKNGLWVFENTSLKYIWKLQVIQNKLLKYIMHLDIRTRNDFLHTSLQYHEGGR